MSSLEAVAPKAATQAEPRPLSRKTADFLAGFRLADAPRAVVDLARIAFIDTVGVMLAGSREPPGIIAADMVRQEGGLPMVSVVGQSFRSSVQLAAFANGVSAHAMDYDFSFASGQAASPVIPALLAVGESVQATSVEMIEAFVAGCEIASRLARVAPRLSNGAGWHAAGTIGAVAAAAAIAKLLKIPAVAIPDAIGISASMAAGLGVNYGTMTKPLHVGQAARNAVVAASLGSRGFTAAAETLEGRTGFIELFAPPTDWPRDAFDNLGRVWDLVERGVTVKLYPCGGLLHTGIEAALHLRDQVKLADIKGIHVGVTAHAGKRASRMEYPASVERAKFSMPYVVGYALVHGAPTLEAFTEAAVEDRRVRDIAKLVSASVDPAFDSTPNQGPSRMTITLKDGRVIEHIRPHASGTKAQPLTQAQLHGKFMSCAVHALTQDRAKTLFDRLNVLADRPSLTDLWPMLTGASLMPPQPISSVGR